MFVFFQILNPKGGSEAPSSAPAARAGMPVAVKSGERASACRPWVAEQPVAWHTRERSVVGPIKALVTENLQPPQWVWWEEGDNGKGDLSAFGWRCDGRSRASQPLWLVSPLGLAVLFLAEAAPGGGAPPLPT